MVFGSCYRMSKVVIQVRILDTWNAVFHDYQITGIIYLCKSENCEVKLSDEHDKYKWVKADFESSDIMYEVFKEKMVNWNWNELKA